MINTLICQPVTKMFSLLVSDVCTGIDLVKNAVGLRLNMNNIKYQDSSCISTMSRLNG